MRARHRHFNPRHAGAIAAYDARFISGLSDGNNVSTWASRTGSNDATQETGGNQPTYETNEINGNPVVLFNGSTEQLVISITIPNSLTTCSVFNRAATNHNSGFFGTNSVTTRRFTAYYFSNNNIYTRYNSEQAWTGHTPTTGSLILSEIKETTSTNQVYVNGKTFRSAQVPLTSNDTFTRVGFAEAGSPSSSHKLGSTCLIDTNVGDALRKRLEHAAAYSFKISCN